MPEDEGPERTCIVTRAKASPDAMIRFVLGPGARVYPDVRRKLPGRGVWVMANEAAVAQAVKRKAFARGFKTSVETDGDLAANVGDLLCQDALQALGMANKAGAVTTGHAKTEALVAKGAVAALVHATDGGADGIRKLDAALRRLVPAAPSIKVFTSQQLDLALGRTNVIHAALTAGPVSQAFLSRCHRLIAYRSVATPSLGADAGKASV